MNKHSEIISRMVGMVYPFIVLFGFYIIMNGHKTPGGGFQGGAVLASVFISRYLVTDRGTIRTEHLQVLEKLLFAGVVLLPVLFVFSQTHQRIPVLNPYYLTAMNILIGFKVCCGLVILFFRFIYHEKDGEQP